MNKFYLDRLSPTKFEDSQKVVQYFPAVRERNFLWLDFIGHGTWHRNSWVHHPETDYLDFQLIEEGEMIVLYKGSKYTVPAGGAILIPPGESRLHCGNSAVCRKRFLGITGDILNTYLKALDLNEVTIIPHFDPPEFEELWSELYTFLSRKKPEKAQEFCSRIFKLLLLLSSLAEMQKYPPELQRAICRIRQDLKFPGSLAGLCAEAGCGKSKLQWQFKHYLASSPIKFLMNKRLEMARHLLEKTDLTIKEIAEKCGFCNQLYFSNVFYKHQGCSPRNYRKLKNN